MKSKRVQNQVVLLKRLKLLTFTNYVKKLIFDVFCRFAEVVVIQFFPDCLEFVKVHPDVTALGAVAVVLLAVLVHVAHLRGLVVAFRALQKRTRLYAQVKDC